MFIWIHQSDFSDHDKSGGDGELMSQERNEPNLESQNCVQRMAMAEWGSRAQTRKGEWKNWFNA
jgi:hypothetical protein